MRWRSKELAVVIARADLQGPAADGARLEPEVRVVGELRCRDRISGDRIPEAAVDFSASVSQPRLGVDLRSER